MTQVRLGLIHALAHSVAPINDALARDWPDALRMNLVDDSLSADLAAGGGLDARMHARFERLAGYAFDCGCDALLFTCSAFGPCIEAVARRAADKPVLKPNEAMISDAAASGLKVGLVATFAPTLRSMPAEFAAPPALALADGALAALNAGQAARHDERIADAALGLVAQGCGIIALAQFSMARAAPLVRERTGVPVLTTVDSAVRALRRRLRID
jgi:aspartate/glutamate racemase